MTKLIVALDFDDSLEALGALRLLRDRAGVEWFKIGPRALLGSSASMLLYEVSTTASLFLDLKLYDTRDTVRATARRAFERGAKMLTVHATPSMLEAAVSAKTADERVLAVDWLTDRQARCHDHGPFIFSLRVADGIVCPVEVCQWFRHHPRWPGVSVHGADVGKLIVCPGIRPVDHTGARDNHAFPASPSEAAASGADFIVVGRPIHDSLDPVRAARSIMTDL